MKKYPIVCICGSMRKYERMLETAETLTNMGYIVLMPFSVKSEGSEAKAVLDDMHKRKIDMADGIVVVASPDGYYGDSTKSEIEYAKQNDKYVTWY